MGKSPKGLFNLKMTKDAIKFRNETYTYQINWENVTKVVLLDWDKRQKLILIKLNKNIQRLARIYKGFILLVENKKIKKPQLNLPLFVFFSKNIENLFIFSAN